MEFIKKKLPNHNVCGADNRNYRSNDKGYKLLIRERNTAKPRARILVT